jgi:hypothetical protein
MAGDDQGHLHHRSRSLPASLLVPGPRGILFVWGLGGGGQGAKSYDGEKVCSSVNHSTLSVGMYEGNGFHT